MRKTILIFVFGVLVTSFAFTYEAKNEKLNSDSKKENTDRRTSIETKTAAYGTVCVCHVNCSEKRIKNTWRRGEADVCARECDNDCYDWGSSECQNWYNGGSMVDYRAYCD